MKASILAIIASQYGSGAAAPVNLVGDGTFTNTFAGWASVRGAVLSLDDSANPGNNSLKIQGSGPSFGTASYAFPTTIGQTYSVSIRVIGFLSTSPYYIAIDDVDSGFPPTWFRPAFSATTSPITYSGSFVATATTHYLNCVTDKANGFLLIDDVEIFEV